MQFVLKGKMLKLDIKISVDSELLYSESGLTNFKMTNIKFIGLNKLHGWHGKRCKKFSFGQEAQIYKLSLGRYQNCSPGQIHTSHFKQELIEYNYGNDEPFWITMPRQLLESSATGNMLEKWYNRRGSNKNNGSPRLINMRFSTSHSKHWLPFKAKNHLHFN